MFCRNKNYIKTIAPLTTTTLFEYNAMGELLATTDPSGLVTSYTYNRLGQLLSRTHPDAGTDTYTYDAAGNMLTHTTQNLSASGDSICYHYSYNRLDSVIYPENTVNNIRYTYGAPTAPTARRNSACASATPKRDADEL